MNVKSFRQRCHGDDASRRFIPCMRIRHLLHVVVALVGLLPSSLSSQEDDIIIKNSLVKGCLHNRLPQHKLPLRVCNSEDNLEKNQGICRIPDFDYLEIRIKCQVSIHVCVCACIGKERNEEKRVP